MQEQRNTWSSQNYTGTSSGIHADDDPTQTDDWIYDTPSRTSTRRYQRAVGQSTPRTVMRVTDHTGRQPIQRSSRFQTQTEPVRTHKKSRAARHWLFYGGVCLLTMLIGWILLSILNTWWTGVQDDWHYGRPRTAQYDENVGHGGVSHFTVENLEGHVMVIEVPANPAQAKIYLGPTLTGTGANLAPPTLSFEDANGDNQIDMVLTVDNVKYLFLNGKNGFHIQQGGGA